MSSIAKKQADYHEFLVILPDGPSGTPQTPGNIDHARWTPRAELRAWISQKVHQWPLELGLILRAGIALILRDTTRCNLIVDRILLHKEDRGSCR
jgi:hypothetical protein